MLIIVSVHIKRETKSDYNSECNYYLFILSQMDINYFIIVPTSNKRKDKYYNSKAVPSTSTEVAR